MLRGLRRGADAADVDEAPYAGLLRRLHQVMRAVEVHRFEGPAAARVLDRRVRKLDGADQGVEAAEGGAEGGGLAHVGGAPPRRYHRSAPGSAPRRGRGRRLALPGAEARSTTAAPMNPVPPATRIIASPSKTSERYGQYPAVRAIAPMLASSMSSTYFVTQAR